MTVTRRVLLKLGSLGTLATLLPAFGRRQDTRDVRGASEARESPLDARYLRHGLNALCSAHATDPFFAGHAGGAVVSAYYLCREETLEVGAAEVIKGALDRHYPLAADPFPKEEPVAGGVEALLTALEPGVDRLCRDGHNVIFLSLALRALHDQPEMATPSRLAALRRTVEALEPKRHGKGEIEVPESTADFAEFVLKEFLACTEGGPGQGYAGHLLTHGRALLDLRLLGHEAFAKKCLNAFQLAVKIARPTAAGADWTAKRRKVEFLRPDRIDYWKRRAAAGSMELGHLFKYPYGYFGVRRHSTNEALKQVCTDQSFRLFTS